MRTSKNGIDFLERHEGVVLRAYRCPAGVLTIGAGLTSASGVVKVKPGMQIDQNTARDLLMKALERNYEPRVASAMGKTQQREFDAGVSFDFNTGAIHRASWIKHFRLGDWGEVKRRLFMWKKGGGRVLPGLVRRRAEEFDLMRFGVYDAHESVTKPKRRPGLARVVIGLDRDEIVATRNAFLSLGYDPGPIDLGFSEMAVRKFQRDHDLTEDGIIGRATLSTLQRRIDAQGRASLPAAGAAISGWAPAATEIDFQPILLIVPLVLLAIALWQVWNYRDITAAKVQKTAPWLARWLRSV